MPVRSQDAEVTHIHPIPIGGVQVGTVVGMTHTARGVEPLLGKKLQVFQIDYAVPAQITHWTAGPHKADQTHGQYQGKRRDFYGSEYLLPPSVPILQSFRKVGAL